MQVFPVSSDADRKAIQRENQKAYIASLSVLRSDGSTTTSAEAIISRMMSLSYEQQKIIKRLLSNGKVKGN